MSRTSLYGIPETPWAQKDPGVTPRACGVVGERAQVIYPLDEEPGHWERLPPTETRSHEGKAMTYA